jgi:GrpB-like predicted nucleotidyltransferase (UPF0157 family)
MERPRKGIRLTDPLPPTSDAQLAAATTNEPEPRNGPIHLSEYDPAWPEVFEAEAVHVREALGDHLLLLEHVGSTSIPGIAAKPKIDMVLAVHDSSDEASYLPAMETAGYTLNNREPDWFEHRLFRSPRIETNIHVFSDDCDEIDRMLLFRDWLRTHPDDRALYEQTKRTLAAKTWKYTQNYADAKAEVVRAILTKAIEAQGE